MNDQPAKPKKPTPTQLARIAGAVVLATWLSNANFRKAWTPEPDLFLGRDHYELARLLAELPREADMSPDGLMWELDSRGISKTQNQREEFEAVLLATPIVADPWAHVEKLKRLRAGRELKGKLGVVFAGLDAGDVDVGGALEQLSAATTTARIEAASNRKMVTLRDGFQRILEGARSGHKPFGFSLGSERVDQLTGGIRAGQVAIIGGESSWGKSSFAIMLAEIALLMGKRVGIVAFEDEPGLYLRRWAAMRAKVNALRFRDNCLTREEWQRLTEVVETCKDDAPILPAVGVPCEDIASDIVSLSRSEGIELWLVDYIQAIYMRQHLDERERIGKVARDLTDAIKNVNTCGVFFSQLTPPDDKKRKNPRPDKTWIRGNKDLGNAAEHAFFGYKKRVQDTDDKGDKFDRDAKFLYLDKVKDGLAGAEEEYDWDTESACFRPSIDLRQQALYDDETAA